MNRKPLLTTGALLAVTVAALVGLHELAANHGRGQRFEAELERVCPQVCKQHDLIFKAVSVDRGGFANQYSCECEGQGTHVTFGQGVAK